MLLTDEQKHEVISSALLRGEGKEQEIETAKKQQKKEIEMAKKKKKEAIDLAETINDIDRRATLNETELASDWEEICQKFKLLEPEEEEVE